MKSKPWKEKNIKEKKLLAGELMTAKDRKEGAAKMGELMTKKDREKEFRLVNCLRRMTRRV